MEKRRNQLYIICFNVFAVQIKERLETHTYNYCLYPSSYFVTLYQEMVAWLRGISSSTTSCHVARDFHIISLSGGVPSLGAAGSNIWLQIRDSPPDILWDVSLQLVAIRLHPAESSDAPGFSNTSVLHWVQILRWQHFGWVKTIFSWNKGSLFSLNLIQGIWFYWCETNTVICYFARYLAKSQSTERLDD